ncbi:sugar phosphate isomerase/epimerase family protein [Massiliimalia massiliensis]|jgi:sugar phosphate isomerase/epimerase|uniref:sugar phosphate isomerase/epimerase family protein n=1 Tax=Massiliimalia massiliensis TaxID=1852384 RepID=UPI000986B810|nr:sugar phosphate isomerase/epimerase family protein [Massiliimalia massiliensis]
MEVGLGSIVYEFGGIPLERQAKMIAEHGIRYVDVLAFGQFNPAFYPMEQQLRVAKEFERCGIRASSVVTCAEGNIGSNDPEERDFAMEQMKRAARLVKRLGGQQILVGKGCGNIDFYLSRKDAFQNSAHFLKEFSKWCKNENIIVTMELEPEALHVCNGIESMNAMIEAIGEDNVFANVDIGHLNILREPPEALELLKGKMIHMHISDNEGLAHTNSVIGEGNSDIRAYIKKAIELGIDETAKEMGDVAVAGIEVGEPGEYITDSDSRVLRSVGNVYLRVPELRKEF